MDIFSNNLIGDNLLRYIIFYQYPKTISLDIFFRYLFDFIILHIKYRGRFMLIRIWKIS